MVSALGIGAQVWALGAATVLATSALSFGVYTILLGVAVKVVFYPPAEPARLDERAVIWDDLRTGLTRSIVIALPVNMFSSSLYLLILNVPAYAMVIAFPFVTAWWVCFVCLFTATATVRYVCAKIVFALNSDFSASPREFLEWARQAGLLRVTGEAYQFRHLTFQQWLLDHADTQWPYDRSPGPGRDTLGLGVTARPGPVGGRSSREMLRPGPCFG